MQSQRLYDFIELAGRIRFLVLAAEERCPVAADGGILENILAVRSSLEELGLGKTVLIGPEFKVLIDQLSNCKELTLELAIQVREEMTRTEQALHEHSRKRRILNLPATEHEAIAKYFAQDRFDELPLPLKGQLMESSRCIQAGCFHASVLLLNQILQRFVRSWAVEVLGTAPARSTTVKGICKKLRTKINPSLPTPLDKIEEIIMNHPSVVNPDGNACTADSTDQLFRHICEAISTIPVKYLG